MTWSFSPLTHYDDGSYRLSLDNYVFIDNFRLSSNAMLTWYTMETHVAFTQPSSVSVDEEQVWGGDPVYILP